MGESQLLHERWPDRAVRESKEDTAPLEDMMSRGERQEIVRKKIIWEYRPLYTLAFVICFVVLVWASAFTVEQLSSNITARACIAAGGDWKIGGEGGKECIGPR